MSSKANAVRTAAKTLADAIDAANLDGLFVAWPRNADGLRTIAISETKRSVKPEVEPTPTLAKPEPSSPKKSASKA